MIEIIHHAADAAEAEAIQAALVKEGINGQVLLGEPQAGTVTISIAVEAADAARARQIIASQSFPRLA